MNNEMLKLAEECGACTMTEAGESIPYHIAFGPEELQAFYDRAFQEGRDSMQFEMSQQEPIAFEICSQGYSKGHLSYYKPSSEEGSEYELVTMPLLYRPQPPQTNKEGK